MRIMGNPAIQEKFRYILKQPFSYRIPSPEPVYFDLDELCDTCDTIKDKEIEKLKAEKRNLLKLIEFLKNEIKSLELKTATSEKAISLGEIVKEFTATPEGQTSLQKAWVNRIEEWKELLKQNKISRIKYYRLIKGIDQKTLANKLGTAQPNITRIEKVGYKPNIDTLRKVAKIFEVRLEDLIGE